MSNINHEHSTQNNSYFYALSDIAFSEIPILHNINPSSFHLTPFNNDAFSSSANG